MAVAHAVHAQVDLGALDGRATAELAFPLLLRDRGAGMAPVLIPSVFQRDVSCTINAVFHGIRAAE